MQTPVERYESELEARDEAMSVLRTYVQNASDPGVRISAAAAILAHTSTDIEVPVDKN